MGGVYSLVKGGCYAEEISPPTPWNETKKKSGDELRNLFTPEVTSVMKDLWERIDEGSYTTEEEQTFIVTELFHHLAVLQVIVSDRQRDMWRDVLFCSAAEEEEVKIPMNEMKRWSERFRALFWQFMLEISSFISDILFLALLAQADYSLFIASCVFLVLAMFARLCSALMLCNSVDYTKIGKVLLYVCGVLVNLVETNTGLMIMRQSLRRTRSGGIPTYYNNAEKVAKVNNKNPVVVLAEINLESGWAEIRNIFAVTVVEDISQLTIQLIYFSKYNSELSQIFIFAVITTVLHILFQWTEAFITYFWICKPVPRIKRGREVGFTSSNQPDPAFVNQSGKLRKRSPERHSWSKVASQYNTEVRVLDFLKASRELVGNKDICLISKFCTRLTRAILSSTAVSDQGVIALANSCRNLTYVRLNETLVSDKGVEKLAIGCPHLTMVALLKCNITNKSVNALVTRCKKLIHIDLTYTGVTDACVEDLAGSGLRLIVLDGTIISDIGLGVLIERGPKTPVKELLLSETKVQSAGVIDLVNTFQNLELIALDDTGIRVEVVEALALCCSATLTRLFLGKISTVDDGAAEHIARLHRLRVLRLLKTRVSDLGIIGIASSCVGLKDLALQGTPVTETGVRAVLQICESLEVLRYGTEQCLEYEGKDAVNLLRAKLLEPGVRRLLAHHDLSLIVQ